jgi:DNA-binding Lrp family transcriptional regulator
MKKTKRKGIWIPNYILEDVKLDAINKIILAEIHSLAELEKGCYASDEHFAKLVGIERPSVNKRIKRIIDMGYLTKRTIKGKGKYLYPKEHVDCTSPVPIVNNTSSLGIEELVPIRTYTSSQENTINSVINSDLLKQGEGSLNRIPHAIFRFS